MNEKMEGIESHARSEAFRELGQDLLSDSACRICLKSRSKTDPFLPHKKDFGLWHYRCLVPLGRSGSAIIPRAILGCSLISEATVSHQIQIEDLLFIRSFSNLFYIHVLFGE